PVLVVLVPREGGYLSAQREEDAPSRRETCPVSPSPFPESQTGGKGSGDGAPLSLRQRQPGCAQPNGPRRDEGYVAERVEADEASRDQALIKRRQHLDDADGEPPSATDGGRGREPPEREDVQEGCDFRSRATGDGVVAGLVASRPPTTGLRDVQDD